MQTLKALTVGQASQALAAAGLSMSPRRLQQLIKAGKLKAYEVGWAGQRPQYLIKERSFLVLAGRLKIRQAKRAERAKR